MTWDGEKLKEAAKIKGVSLISLSQILNVSRQTINDWIKGQIPKGSHLVALCKALDVSPNYFFPDETPAVISVPLHRKRGVAKITTQMKQEATQIAKHYEKLFKLAPEPGLVPVLRLESKDRASMLAMAEKLRRLSGIDSHKPMDYEHTFKLLSSLGVVTIFRYFPRAVKGYAFYCRIHKQRVVFVNNYTNILDLIFPLLHEAIHAIRDEEQNAFGDPDEEEFCDSVANHVQFPEPYVTLVYKTIKDLPVGAQINQLKNFSKENSHSLFGIVEQLKELDPTLELDVGGANTNLKKQFPTIGEILFRENEARSYIQHLQTLSPLFIDVAVGQIKNATTRKIGDWFGLESRLDAEQVMAELQRIAEGKGC